MAKVRVLVIEDSLTIRRRLVEALEGDADIEVVGEAANGEIGFDLCQKLRPDVVTLDMMMPVKTGLETTELIMAWCPTPILVVSASMNRGSVLSTYDALAAGALDVLDKPTGAEPEGVWEARFRSTVKMLARIKVVSHVRGRLESGVRARVPSGLVPLAPEPCRAIAIGASTGGPGAVLEILRALPADFAVPVLVVLHMGSKFGFALADWLQGLCRVPVAYAVDRQPLPPVGQPGVLVAPPDKHLILQGGLLRLTDGPERHFCRPAVDELFESVARELGPRSAACLLTGMGRDGADGMLAIHRAGGRTIAQDEATSVVFGMPGAAVKLGAAQQILPLGRIADALLPLHTKSRKS